MKDLRFTHQMELMDMFDKHKDGMKSGLEYMVELLARDYKSSVMSTTDPELVKELQIKHKHLYELLSLVDGDYWA